jgi:hypothetical protein
MYLCTIEIDGWKVIFESSKELVPSFLRLALTPAFLDLKVLPQVSLGEYKIIYEESISEVVVNYSSNVAVIRAPWLSLHDGETLLYASLPFVELQRQNHGFVTIHAAAVSFNEKAVLILGKEGSGKTIAALTLCKNYGGKLIGNDLVVVGLPKEDDNVIMRSGTKFLHLRYESISRNMPELLHLFPEKNDDSWLRKVIIDPPDAGIDLCFGKVSLLNVFLVHIDETKDNLLVKSADTIVNRLYLNENFSRYIKGTCITLFGEKLNYLGYVPSFDSKLLFLKRANIMELLFAKYSMKFVSGSLEKVTEYIFSNV